MKKTIAKFFAALVLLLALTDGGRTITKASQPSGEKQNWYFKSAGDGSQPVVNGGQCYPQYRVLSLGDPDDKVIYLTFDAGYGNENVKKILDTLKKHQAPAAFFILPGIIRNSLELVNRMFEEGHTVCNHTYSHRDIAAMTESQLSDELTKLESLCLEKTGREMSHYFRPPEGSFSEAALGKLCEMGYTTVFWSFAYADWDNSAQPDPQASLNRLLAHTHNGMVLLLHPTSATNAGILDSFLTELESRGYRFGTLDELASSQLPQKQPRGFDEVSDNSRQQPLPSIFFEQDAYSMLESFKKNGDVLCENRSAGKKLALTFDDGPDPVYTEQILDILAEYSVKATFFMIGKSIEKYPDIARRVVAEGHEAANHTYSHCKMSNTDAETLRQEISRTAGLLREIGSGSRLFRPPGGAYSRQSIESVLECDMKYVLWSWRQDTRDWSCPGVDHVVSTVLDNLNDGDIILFHDGNTGKSPTPQALKELLPILIEKGYEFVTVSELFGVSEVSSPTMNFAAVSGPSSGTSTVARP